LQTAAGTPQQQASLAVSDVKSELGADKSTAPAARPMARNPLAFDEGERVDDFARTRL